MFTQKLWPLLIFTFTCICLNSYAQKVTTFQKIYGTANDDYGTSIVGLPDKGFLLAGITGNESPVDTSGDFSILIIRVDSLGRQKWAKTFNGTKASGVFGYIPFAMVDMMMAPDGNVAVYSCTGASGGTVNGYYNPGHAYLFKIDLNGKVLWSRIYLGGLGTIVNAPQGGFTVLTTFSRLYHNSVLLNTDDTGGIVWIKRYGNVASSPVEFPYAIATCRNGGYLMTGSIDVIPSEESFIKKIDSKGILTWAKEYYDSNNNLIGSFILELPDKTIYNACGADGDYPIIFKTDSLGKVIWAKQYGFSISSLSKSQFLSMVYDSIHKVFNIGFSANTGTQQGIGVLRLDTSGKIIFSKIYGPAPKTTYFAANFGGHNLIQLPNDGIAFLQSTSIGTVKGSDFYFIKTDDNGNTDSCNYTSYPFSTIAISIIGSDYINPVADIATGVAHGCTASPITILDSFTCPPIVAGFGWDSMCLGQTTQFIDSTYYKPVYWKWDFGDGGKSSQENPTHKYAKTGSYNVKLVTGNGTNTDSVIKIVTIYSKVFHARILDTLICGSTPFTLRASGGLYYTWRPGNLLNDSTSTTPKLNLNKSVQFIVEAGTGGNCITFDTINIVVDNKPAPPRISYATIKTGSEIEVRFQRSDSNDVKAYQVLRSVNGGAFSLLQSINNPSNSDSFYFIKDSSVNAAANTYSYKILALDSCGAVSDTSTAHQPMLLAVKQVGCEQALRLSWSSYMGWPARVYQILRSANGGADSLIATLAGTATTYNDTGLNHLNKYCYTILAQDSIDSFRSYSNTVCKQTFFPDTPQVLSVSKISTSTTNGTVVIKWGGINQRDIAYNELFFSRDVKNFSLVGSHLLPGIDSFAQSGLDTKDSDYEYYLVTVDSCGAQSIQSPVSKTMTLTVTVGQLLHKLNWTPYLGFKIKIYDIERFENGQFVTIDSVPGTDTFSKEFPAPCNYAIRYRIAAIGYGSGETAWSDTMGRQAIDTIPSDPPIMVNATVLSGSSAKINFTGSDSADTYQFAIQRSVDGNWGTAGTILFTKPGDLLQFTDAGLNTVKNHICYTVITLDSCLNASSSDTFCLINLQGKGVQMSDSLYWYPFAGYGLKDYAVLTLGPSGVWDTLTTVNASDTAYYNANLKCGQTITYKIAGTGKTGSRLTFSDSITITPFDTIKPPAPALYYATVLPDQTVKLNWQWNPAGIVKYFEVWRSTNHAPPVLIDSVTADSVYIDKGANVKNNLYSYSITAIDSCNTSNRSKPSQTDSLMKLKLYSLYCSPQVQVHWTPFTGLPNGVVGYNILRSTDGADFIKINSVSPSATVYIDTNVVIGKQYYYKTEAIDSKSGYSSASDTLGIIPRIIPDADSAQLVYATVLKSDENNGAIYIRWKRAPLNDTNARGYYVYSYNSKNGKYALLKDVANLNDTSFINNNINTLQDIYKYYIITYNVCDVGVNSNIHKTVLLKVQNNNLQEQLNWSNYLGVPVRGYSVYKSEDGGAQFLLDSAALDSSRSDSNVSCGHSFTYQVQAMLANGEISFSDSITVKSFDTIAPKTKPIVVVTVVRTGLKDGRIKIDWLPAFDKNLEGYNIYRSNDGLFWLQVSSGFAGRQFIDTALSTYGQSYYYKIQPVDSCGNVGAFTIYHESIHLKAQSGSGFNRLMWNGYEGWNVKKYLLYRDGILIDTVDNNVFDFKDTEVICNVVYQYLIKATDADNDTVLSSSNTDSAKAANHNPPQKVYIKTVTVSKPNKEAFISWTPSKSYDVKDYLVYRKDAQTGDMQLTGSTTAANYSDSAVTISPPLGVRGGCYYVFARDHCGNISDASNEGCIILLNAQNQPGYNQLSWNSYQYWPDGVQSYNVYKNEDSTGWQLIGTTSSVQVNQFKDSKLGDSTIDFCYQVQAIENPGQYNQLSRSTVVCVHQDATVFIPNTFTPYNADGLNDYFAPKGLYIKSYDMKIYNQWGELVYAGSIPQAPLKGGASPQPSPGGEGAGWDGTFHGVPVQQGVYIYLITVTDYNNKQSHFKGTITMFE